MIWYIPNLEISFFFKILFIYFEREGKGGRKRGRETSMCGCLSRTPLLGTWPNTQACALTRNRTGNLLVCRPTLNPLSYTNQGPNLEISIRGCYQMFLDNCVGPRNHTITFIRINITISCCCLSCSEFKTIFTLNKNMYKKGRHYRFKMLQLIIK